MVSRGNRNLLIRLNLLNIIGPTDQRQWCFSGVFAGRRDLGTCQISVTDDGVKHL